MKMGNFSLWRSRAVCWWSFALFSALTIVWQFIDVKPYPHMQRDLAILTGGCATAALLFLILAVRATRKREHDQA
jgi:hypothetical protein